MSEKVTPRVDIVFKKLFGVEENKDLLISLINSIVSAEDQVVDVDILNPYNTESFMNDKLSILDIKAKGYNGKRYNIEMQISDEADYDKRALYYWAKFYTEQLAKSEPYSNLNKTIGIHILNFLSIPNSDKYHNVFHLLEQDTKLHYFKDIELHTIELNKFERINNVPRVDNLQQLLPKIKTSLDRWVAFLARYDLLEIGKLPKELKDPNVEKALEVLEIMNFNRVERQAFEDHLKWLRMEDSALRKVFADGMEKRELEIATNMLNTGIAPEVVAQVTGLEMAVIQNLLKR